MRTKKKNIIERANKNKRMLRAKTKIREDHGALQLLKSKVIEFNGELIGADAQKKGRLTHPEPQSLMRKTG